MGRRISRVSQIASRCSFLEVFVGVYLVGLDGPAQINVNVATSMEPPKLARGLSFYDEKLNRSQGIEE